MFKKLRLSVFCSVSYSVKRVQYKFWKDFRITPYICYACRLIKYVYALLFWKTIGTPEGIDYIHWKLLLTVWIKEDFIARCLFADSFLTLPPFLSLFLLHIIQAPCAFFSLAPCRSRTRYLSHTSRLLVSLLHHYTTRINWELPLESALLFYLTRYFRKIYITIYLFISLKHVSRRTKECIGSLVSFVCSS